MPLSIAIPIMASMAGCPGGPGITSTPGTTGDNTTQVVTGSPQPKRTPLAEPTDAVATPGTTRTPGPVVTQGPQATPPPSGLFATPTPTPTASATPAFVNLGVLIDQGATSSSPYELNRFRIRFEGDDRLTPDLPSRRTYSAVLLQGHSKAQADEFGVVAEVKKVVPTTADWAITKGRLTDGATTSATLSWNNVCWFVVGSGTASTVTNTSSVVVEVGPVAAGTMLTFEATVSIASPDMSVADSGPKTMEALILASNQGWMDVTIQSIDSKVPHPARLVP